MAQLFLAAIMTALTVVLWFYFWECLSWFCMQLKSVFVGQAEDGWDVFLSKPEWFPDWFWQVLAPVGRCFRPFFLEPKGKEDDEGSVLVTLAMLTVLIFWFIVVTFMFRM